MSQLIQMRQRIRAIETIKKITHAMRLISMSLHARLKSKEATLFHYYETTHALFHKVKMQTPSWQNNLVYPPVALPTKTLIIVIGSHKGLCGNFNTALFKLVEMQTAGMVNAEYIGIGKKAIEYLKEHAPNTIVHSYPVITYSTLFSIARSITKIITQNSTSYTQVLVLSNLLKTFFLQRPRMTQLIPFAPSSSAPSSVEYLWEEKPDIILDYLAQQCIETTLQHLLFQSLVAEQAARFISMDASTRNAKNILEETKQHYNKVRQTKITQEVTELTSSF